MREQIIEMGRGIAFPSISRRQIEDLPIPLPSPEQHRIVAKVDELMALCDELEARVTKPPIPDVNYWKPPFTTPSMLSRTPVMMTFKQFAAIPKSIPAAASWYLADLGEAKGKQELFTRQVPQKLKALWEHALIESAVSSNRIEGVTVEPGRVKAVVLGKALLQDRDEEEVRGYRRRPWR